MADTSKNSLERIRLAFLVPYSGMSGAEISIRYLLEAMPKTEFEVYLIAPPGQPLLQIADAQGWKTCTKTFPKFMSTSIELTTIRIPNPLAVIYDLCIVFYISLWLAGYVRQNRIQAVYTCELMTHLVSILSKSFQPKLHLFIHMQSMVSPRFVGGLGRRFFNSIVSRATRIIAVSKAVLETLPASSHAALVYNTADVSAYDSIVTSSLREEMGIAVTEPLVGIVGRLIPWKGHRVFLDAVHRLVQTGTQGRFIIVGDDIDPVTGQSQFRPELEEYAKALNIQDRVIFTGFRKDIPNVLRGLDVLVIPSLRPDPCPLVAFEGMASGLPVVGSNSGGIAEVILDGKTGRLFPPGDSAVLAGILQELIAQPTLRAQYGEAARQRLKDNFSLSYYTNALINIFRQASEV